VLRRPLESTGKLPVNFQLGAFYNAVRPSYTGAWSLRTQVTLIF
jgi:hypothetical protein